MKSLPPTPRWPKNIILEQFPVEERPLLNRKIVAMERFVNLNAVGYGCATLRDGNFTIAKCGNVSRQRREVFPVGSALCPNMATPQQLIVRLTLQDRARHIEREM